MINGRRIDVNADGIGEGMLRMLDELPPQQAATYKGALAYGMLPGPLMELLEQGLREKAERIAREQAADDLGIPLDELDRAQGAKPIARPEWVQQFVRDVSRAVASCMYARTRMKV